MFGKSKKQNIEGDGNTQINVDKIEIKYDKLLQQEQVDMGIISDIFGYVKENIKSQVNSDKSKPESLLKVDKKIKKNFKIAIEQKDVENYLTFALQKTALIERRFSELDSSEQNDLHSFIYNQYSSNRSSGLSNMDNLRNLFTCFTPKGKESNPEYVNFAIALVLFFFGDCTIFEKTRAEKVKSKLNKLLE